jgi:hypothetical protein
MFLLVIAAWLLLPRASRAASAQPNEVPSDDPRPGGYGGGKPVLPIILPSVEPPCSGCSACQASQQAVGSARTGRALAQRVGHRLSELE